MRLKDIVSISGMPGLYKVVSQRPDGLIVSALGEDRSKFVSNRIHMFTPLEGITIYTTTDSIELAKVLENIKSKGITPVGPKESNQAHKDFMQEVLPDFDEEKVYVSDIKKLVKWYLQLDEHGMVTLDDDDAADADAEVTFEEVSENAADTDEQTQEEEE